MGVGPPPSNTRQSRDKKKTTLKSKFRRRIKIQRLLGCHVHWLVGRRAYQPDEAVGIIQLSHAPAAARALALAVDGGALVGCSGGDGLLYGCFHVIGLQADYASGSHSLGPREKSTVMVRRWKTLTPSTRVLWSTTEFGKRARGAWLKNISLKFSLQTNRSQHKTEHHNTTARLQRNKTFCSRFEEFKSTISPLFLGKQTDHSSINAE